MPGQYFFKHWVDWQYSKAKRKLKKQLLDPTSNVHGLAKKIGKDRKRLLKTQRPEKTGKDWK
jgi:hypothetical protein